ncbi:MAG TPA: hypothetical protein VHB78_00355 [Vicinamibacterales bacterium]|jgi:thioredoxin-related protein|nr:hypothetical protein [Vicinamibacterales bacterium]
MAAVLRENESMGNDVRDYRGRIAVGIIVFCAFGLAATALAGFSPAIKTALGWTSAERAAYVPGDSIDVPRDFYDKNDQTLLVFASGTCGACLRSASSLGKMAEELRGSRTRFLLVTPAVRHVDQQTLVSTASLHAAESVALDLTTLRLKNVPTFVLVNQTGRILYSREGYLDEDGSEAVRSAISRRQS